MTRVILAFKRAMMNRWTYRIIRWSLASIFIYAGTTKLMDPFSFALIIDSYALVPASWVRPIALWLPGIEVIAACALLFDIRGSLVLITLLLFIFMGVLSYGIWMGFELTCGCIGADE